MKKYGDSKYNNKGNNSKVIKEIIRVKNGFSNIDDESWKLDASSFGYRDIKFTVSRLKQAKKENQANHGAGMQEHK